MKIFIALILTVLAYANASGQARPGAYPWKITLKATDESGQPVAGVAITASYQAADTITGFTDAEGVFIAKHTDRTYELNFVLQKEGFYADRLSYDLYKPGQFDDGKVASNRNAVLTFVLRRIGSPIPMFAKRVRLKFQKEDMPLAFDLMAGDWVVPEGTGRQADLFFTVHRTIINKHEYHCDLKLTFPNKEDGIAVSPADNITGSEFKTARVAAEKGYQSELEMHFSHTNHPVTAFGYLVRVRTELDGNGKVTNALYGKVPEGFNIYAGTIVPHAGMSFKYYLNPATNDRNLEFDPKKNLMKGLKMGEEVNDP